MFPSHDPLESRGIDGSVASKYKVTVSINPDNPIEAVFPRFNEEGQHIANQIRYDDKGFSVEGIVKGAALFGQQLFPAGGKSITVTEGYYDTLASFQMTGSRYPNVGVMSASSAKQEVIDNFEYLNSFEKIVFNLDSDDPGQKAAKDCAQLFEPGKVHILTLKDHKDANEYLMADQGKKYIDRDWETHYQD